jgi:hypothetical protein
MTQAKINNTITIAMLLTAVTRLLTGARERTGMGSEMPNADKVLGRRKPPQVRQWAIRRTPRRDRNSVSVSHVGHTRGVDRIRTCAASKSSSSCPSPKGPRTRANCPLSNHVAPQRGHQSALSPFASWMGFIAVSQCGHVRSLTGTGSGMMRLEFNSE